MWPRQFWNNKKVMHSSDLLIYTNRIIIRVYDYMTSIQLYYWPLIILGIYISKIKTVKFPKTNVPFYSSKWKLKRKTMELNIVPTLHKFYFSIPQ